MVAPEEFDFTKYFDLYVVDENNQRVIILVCEDLYSAKQLNDILRFNKYQMTVAITEKKAIILDTIFTDTDARHRLQFKTVRTTLEDPALIWLLQGSVPYITTGFPDENDMLLRLKDLVRMDRPVLN